MDGLEDIKEKLYFNAVTYLEGCNVWVINVNQIRCYFQQIVKTLSQEEITRSNVIKNKKIRELFCLRKGITRILISEYLEINYWEICYYYNEYNKPYVYCNNNQKIYFNISHSKEYLVIGISKAHEIGVDVEKIVLKPRTLPKEIFTYQELQLFNKYDEIYKNQAAYNMWVQKEAICKALGVGITIELNQFSVRVNPCLGYQEYYIYVDSFKCHIKVKVYLKNEYAFAIALIK